MTEAKSNLSTLVLFALAIAFLLWPLAMGGGCTPRIGGFEIGTWLGKVKVKPLPVEPVAPPATRCLVFGFDSCPGCVQLHRTIRRELIPHGWKVGSAATDDIEEVDIRGRDPKVKRYRHSSYPTLIIVDQSGKEIDRRERPMKGAELIEWIQSTRK